MRGKRKQPQSTVTQPEQTEQLAAQCEDCTHVWFLRGTRIGRCPSCKRLGSAKPVRVLVQAKVAA
jgi:hypothetical protein